MGIEGCRCLGHGLWLHKNNVSSTGSTEGSPSKDAGNENSSQVHRLSAVRLSRWSIERTSSLGRVMTIKIAIAGAAGRMGQQLIQVVKRLS